MVLAQIDACICDIGVDAVKIGMLGSARRSRTVADRLEAAGPDRADRVRSGDGRDQRLARWPMRTRSRPSSGLMALATLTTPNLPELAALGGDAVRAAGAVRLLAKGGDAEGDTC
jgi:hydroxymethylpyrimidine/phosphomethylpyrimidine kinase